MRRRRPAKTQKSYWRPSLGSTQEKDARASTLFAAGLSAAFARQTPYKTTKRLRVEHFNLTGVDADVNADITGSDLDSDKAIEEEYSQGEELSEEEETGPKHENPRLVQFQRKRSPELGEDAELEAVVYHASRPKSQTVSFQSFVDKTTARAQNLKEKPDARFECPLQIHRCEGTKNV
ncbi:hypothetical protein KCU77_g17002, partial [Aureobasidium melanogenum]